MSDQDKQPTVDPVLWRKALAKRRREEKDLAQKKSLAPPPQPGEPAVNAVAEQWILEDEFPESQKDNKTPQGHGVAPIGPRHWGVPGVAMGDNRKNTDEIAP